MKWHHQVCPISTPSIQDINTICQRYLALLYTNVFKEVSHQALQSGHNMTQTNGEILPGAIDKLLTKIRISTKDIFMDLGSGCGKVVAQVFLRSLVHEAYGMEIVPALHQQAMAAAEKIRQDLPGFYAGNRRLAFLQGDFLAGPLPPATIAFMNATCFSPAMLYALGHKMNHMDSIHTVLTLRPLLSLQRLRIKKIIAVECSWGSALCYVYR